MDSGLNWQIAHVLNGLAGQSPLLDAAARFAASDLIFLFVLFPLLWWFLPLPGDQGKMGIIAAGLALGGGLVLTELIGHLYYVPRPFVAHQVLVLMPHAADSSFPSSHSTAAFAIAMTGVFRRLPGGWLSLVGAILIALARVIVGVHYPVDVIGGFMIGALAAVILRQGNALLLHSYRRSVTYLQRLQFGEPTRRV